MISPHFFHNRFRSFFFRAFHAQFRFTSSPKGQFQNGRFGPLPKDMIKVGKKDLLKTISAAVAKFLF
jgi:hypothetical protein